MKIAHKGPNLTHLFFANDSLIFCKASVQEAKVVIQIDKGIWESIQPSDKYRKILKFVQQKFKGGSEIAGPISHGGNETGQKEPIFGTTYGDWEIKECSVQIHKGEHYNPDR